MDSKIGRFLQVDPLAGKYANQSPYNYCINNPLIYNDPDGCTVRIDSLGNKSEIDDNIDQVEYWDSNTNSYVVLNNPDGSSMSISEFHQFVATVYAESSGDHTESAAIADVIVNRTEELNTDNSNNNTDISYTIENTGIYGYQSNNYNNIYGSNSNSNNALLGARLGVVDALTGNTDSSNGAYFWEGTTIENSNNYFRNLLDSDPPVFRITTTHGRTTFMQYDPNNPEYGNRTYP